MIIDEEAYLEHHGVKGMHWGIRSNRQGSGSGSPTKQQIRTGQIKFARNAAIGVTVGIGAGIVAGKLVGRSVSKAQIRKSVKAFDPTVRTMMTKSGKNAVNTIRPSSGKGKISPDTAKFLTKFAENQTNLNRLANGDLKSLYEKGQVPLHVREYLSDWT